MVDMSLLGRILLLVIVVEAGFGALRWEEEEEIEGEILLQRSARQVHSQTQGSVRLRTSPRSRNSLPNLNGINIQSSVDEGINAFRNMKEKELEFISRRQFLSANSPARVHGRIFIVKPSSIDTNDAALQVVRASQALAKQLGISPSETEALRSIPLRGTPFEQFCPRIPQCDPNAKFRTITGECNNLQRPNLGRSNTPVGRSLPALYNDGVFEARTRGVNGGALTNPRVIGNTVLLDKNNPDQGFTISVMIWSQLVDHDLALTPFTQFVNGEGIECCPNKAMPQGPDEVFELCNPIAISRQDRFFGPRNQTCMNFIRSMLAINNDCAFGPAEQIEVLTHWADGSFIYGSEPEDIEIIRTKEAGLLRVSTNNLLPFNPDGGACAAPLRGAQCFIAGESRVQENPPLAVGHTIFHREHNRIATELGHINPSWDDERIFEEARRINVAQYQHILYEEWLPIIIGSAAMTELELKGKANGFSFDYDPTIDPSIGVEFATAAFRFGHSIVVSVFKLISDLGKVSTFKLRDHFNTGHLLQQVPGAYDMLIRGSIIQPIQKLDPFITSELSNHLLQTPAVDFGLDLMSINLQRGRDHAIATYNDFREACGSGRATSFQDLTDNIAEQLVQRLALVYNSVDDIDLFVGGMIENPHGNGLVGRTFACIIGDQFRRSRKGDRFFYDLGGQPGSFTPEQLQEIRKSSWARIICDNADNIPRVQPQAFRTANRGSNRFVSCSGPEIPKINLRLFG